MTINVRTPSRIRFTELWIVSKEQFDDLERNYYLAVRDAEGKTYRGPGVSNLDKLDVMMMGAYKTHTVNAKMFRETDEYGIDFLEEYPSMHTKTH